MRIVWVLGTGFSQSLGGPMLNDLFSKRAESEIAARYSGLERIVDERETIDTVLRVYRQNLERPDEPGAGKWHHGEEFLEYLDLAALEHKGGVLSPRVKLLPNFGTPLETVANVARRIVAAECCGFLEEADDSTVKNSERWGPYRRWAAELLAPEDTIITFNYDRVIERLATAVGGHLDEDVIVAGDNCKRLNANGLKVLKLHGSVDWERDDSLREIKAKRTADPKHALTCDAEKIAIATPGSSKATLTTVALGPLWNAARHALEFANVIIFIGYRFPPSDAEARRRLLGAVAANRQKYLRVLTILGPDLGLKDAVRLRHLIRYALHTSGRQNLDDLGDNPLRWFRYLDDALYAEDFLSVLSRQWLVDDYGNNEHQPMR